MYHLEPLPILLIEDNPDHAELTIAVFEDNGLANPIYWVKDGEEALDFLYHRGEFSDPESSPRPGLILLDLRLPKKDGLEVLATIKSDDELATIPVVILTTSKRDEEVVRGYQLGANSFVSKPVDFGEFVETIRQVKMYWLLTNRLPRR
ncbi:MAG: response regulator [Armatimonadetes bacterium]|nr:response regulator [Armatimonadota bacterium]